MFSLIASLLLPVCTYAVLTSDEKDKILQKHNDLRAAIATPCTAADMETLAWDDTLATESQAWADGCVGDHADGAGNRFGENLWMQLQSDEYTADTLVGAVQEWYDEIKDVEWIKDANGEYTEAKSKPGAAGCASPDDANGNCFIGHFTQVVWAKSNKVGCGLKTCAPLEVSAQAYTKGAVLVCRYLPSGNSAPQANSPNHVKMPFTPGQKCASCAGSCSTAGLCNAGATPTRCADKSPPYALNNVDHPTCTAYVSAISVMFGQTGKWACTATDANAVTMIVGYCDQYCEKCTAPSGIGKAFCGGSSGGNTTGGDAGGANGNATTVKPKEGSTNGSVRKGYLAPWLALAVLGALCFHRQ